MQRTEALDTSSSSVVLPALRPSATLHEADDGSSNVLVASMLVALLALLVVAALLVRRRRRQRTRAASVKCLDLPYGLNLPVLSPPRQASSLEMYEWVGSTASPMLAIPEHVLCSMNDRLAPL
ncbi:hypothetical protein SDRG_03930 [Saprolegnia diclina VS20]|uniref:Uncharacterized protein n=1 Tax=Saprolegnia diclina (strain VS20) TaxID=1156394 RepID=T0S8M9_SAPDV|nr:hypothetical protein SDRG_03930 [Saprolegnia diclina VS20]EQC38977.1 hypothetical protein SDRG_03930 [Saprolegnia diclina VS20]|eukprot:XP_008607801.1 hypothetical protein SDRG_03930 [Saprolegnia diclina VS20]